MSADQAEPSDNTSNSSVKAGPASEPAVDASESNKIDAPKLVPEQGQAAGPEAPKAIEPPRPSEPRQPGKIMVMSPVRGESWSDERIGAEEPASTKSGLFGKRRVAALAAVIALAAVFGAVGGALATAGLGLVKSDENSSAIQSKLLDQSIARIESELAALKSSVDATAKASASQANKLGDRIEKVTDRVEKVEKAQGEPAAKIAKLSEAVEKLRAAPTPAPTPVAAAPARETTGSITPTPASAPKPEVARLPTVDGWVLREVSDGVAVISGRTGTYEVYAGDPVPGLGRIDAIRRQDGRWVVVTSRGLITAR